MTINVTSDRKQSNSSFNRSGGNRSNRAHWWMRRVDGDFIALPKRVRGDSYLDLEMDLAPDQYLIGVGTGKDAIREVHTVTAAGEWI